MQRCALTCLLAIGMLLCLQRASHAGVCLDDSEFVDAVKVLEAFAKNPKTVWPEYAAMCLYGALERPALAKRVDKACTKVLARDGMKSAMCVNLEVSLGHTSVGDVIFVDYFLAQPIKPLDWDRGDVTVMQLGRLADPRGADKIVEAWKATIDIAAKHEKRKNRTQIMAWSGWRKDAAKALGQAGELAAKEFLVEQMALTKDRYLKKECVAAIALIDARLAAKSTVVSPPPAATPPPPT
jgi:hypothetical protein